MSKKPADNKTTVLQAAKATESPNSLIFILHDINAMKVIEAWHQADPKFVDRPFREGEKLDAALEEIWLGCEVDLVSLADKTPLSLNLVSDIFNRLRKARLIYPDGTCHKSIDAIISNEVGSYLKTFLKI